MSFATAPPDDSSLDSVIHSFIHAFPDPSDDQVHKFAALIGLDKASFEERMFAQFGEELQCVNDLDDAIEDLDETDKLICRFFTVNKEPTEEQIHALAEVLGMEPEDFEEHIYALMTALDEVDDTEDDADVTD